MVFFYTVLMNKKFESDDDRKDFLINLFKNLISDKENFKNNRKLIDDTLNKIITSDFLSFKEIKLLILENEVVEYFNLNDFIAGMEGGGGGSASYSETWHDGTNEALGRDFN